MDLEKNNKIKKATYFAIFVSSFLFLLKIFNFNISHSHAINLSAIDSFMDLFISFLNLFAVYLTSLKKNIKAPKGFDKVASIITLIQSILIFIFSSFMIYDLTNKLFNKTHEIHNINSSIYIIIGSLLISIILVFYQKKVIKETNSIIIKADMIHYSSDIISNISLLIGMIFMKYFKIYWLDAIIALIFTFYLLISVCNLLKTSLYSLLDFNNIEESLYIKKILKKNNIDLEDNNVNIFFSGTKYIIEIFINNNSKNQEIKKVINNSLKEDQKNHECKIGCSHISNGLKNNATFEVLFILN